MIKVQSVQNDFERLGFDIITGREDEELIMNRDQEFTQWCTMSTYPNLPEGFDRLEIYNKGFYMAKTIRHIPAKELCEKYNLYQQR